MQVRDGYGQVMVVDGEDLVQFAIAQKSGGAQQALDVLVEIIGQLVDRLPEEDRLSVCRLQYLLDRVGPTWL